MEATGPTATKREVRQEFQLTPPTGVGSFALMKQVLSLLVCFVFLQTQSWALSGGPFGGSTASSSLTGTYAGVLIPQVAPAAGTATSIGLFTLMQPDSGQATGSLLVFVNGTAFQGTITGVIDPGTGSLRAVVDATSTFTVTLPITVTSIVNGVPVTTTSVQQFPITAQGSIDATVRLDNSRNAFVTATGSPARIAGEATLDIFFRVDSTTGTPIITQTTGFIVDGFKQSDT